MSELREYDATSRDAPREYSATVRQSARDYSAMVSDGFAETPPTTIIEDFEDGLGDVQTVDDSGDPSFSTVERNGDNWLEIVVDDGDTGFAGSSLDGTEYTVDIEIPESNDAATTVPCGLVDDTASALLIIDTGAQVFPVELNLLDEDSNFVDNVGVSEDLRGKTLTAEFAYDGSTMSVTLQADSEYNLSGAVDINKDNLLYLLGMSGQNGGPGTVYYDDVRQV